MSDMHGSYDRVESIVEAAGGAAGGMVDGKVDATVLAGDITHFGNGANTGMVNIIEWLRDRTGNVFAVLGNCDPTPVAEIVEKAGATLLHGRAVMWHGPVDVCLLGLSGSTPTPFNTPSEYPEEVFEGILEDMLSAAEDMGAGRVLHGEDAPPLVLVSHTPPHGVLDTTIRGDHVGSQAVRNVLGKVDVLICGHVHEAYGVEQVEKTLVVNVAEASKGRGALVCVGDQQPSAKFIEPL
ncbi:MAG: metallophosphoesterase family protein [Methermicoccaceae archaeon]